MHANESEIEKQEKECYTLPYRTVVGCLQYLVGGSTPDLARIVSEKLNNVTKRAWKMAQHVLKYLVETRFDGIEYDLGIAKKYGCVKIEAFVDAIFANDPVDRRSVTGFAVFCNGQLISPRVGNKTQSQRAHVKLNLLPQTKHYVKLYVWNNCWMKFR